MIASFLLVPSYNKGGRLSENRRPLAGSDSGIPLPILIGSIAVNFFRTRPSFRGGVKPDERSCLSSGVSRYDICA